MWLHIIVLRGIRLYQHTLSSDHGVLRVVFPFGCCIYHPTCSVYTAQAIAHAGVRKGLWMGLQRILRCHPWAQGGNDPVPPVRPGQIILPVRASP